jgi:hypothetical protein
MTKIDDFNLKREIKKTHLASLFEPVSSQSHERKHPSPAYTKRIFRIGKIHRSRLIPHKKKKFLTEALEVRSNNISAILTDFLQERHNDSSLT